MHLVDPAADDRVQVEPPGVVPVPTQHLVVDGGDGAAGAQPVELERLERRDALLLGLPDADEDAAGEGDPGAAGVAQDPDLLLLAGLAAQLLGKNRSDFMLEAACDKAQAVLLDQVLFSLDETRFRKFTELLDAPVQANPGLERLLAVQPPWSPVP